MSICVHAQVKNFEYIDSSLLQDDTGFEDEVVTDSEETATDELPTDTFATIREIVLPTDTVLAWQRSSRYKTSKNLDSALLAWQQKEKPRETSQTAIKSISFFAGIFNSGIFATIAWIVAIIFVVFIISKLFVSKGIFSRTANSAPVVAEQESEEQRILEGDFLKLIREAEQKADWRAATRYHFLQAIVLLNQKELIQFSIDKTNSRYVQEVAPQFKAELRNLVRTYEYVWFGHTELMPVQYEHVATDFTNFLNRLA